MNSPARARPHRFVRPRLGVRMPPLAAACLLVCGTAGALSAQSSTGSMSLQGKLSRVQDGPHDLVLYLYDAPTGGIALHEVTVTDVHLSGGVFSMAAPIDPSHFDGSDRWWAVAVDGGPELTPRTLVTAVPYASSTDMLAGGRIRLVTDSNGTVYTGVNGPLLLSPWAFHQEDGYLALHDESGGKRFEIQTQLGTPVAHFHGREGNPAVYLVHEGGLVGIGTSNPLYTLDVAGNARVDDNLRITGETVTSILRITGGGDLAEPFDVALGTALPRVEPGMVLSIDRRHDGKLIPCSTPYDTAVAGVVSGAGGLSPGMIMSAKDHELVDGEHPVAMTGRVWTLCDADSGGPIQRGDRLTTSATLGHAMRAGDGNRSDGAVIGKAMSELERGRGLVLVLVNLQ